MSGEGPDECGERAIPVPPSDSLREDEKASRPPSGSAVMFKRVKRIFLVLVVVLFVASAYIAWSGLTGRDLPGPIRDAIGAGGEVVGSDSHFSDLKVTKGDDSHFDATITVQNTGGTYQDVIVTVSLFDGDQNVGTLMGTVTLKPNRSSSTDLFSADDYVAWTDAHVDLLRS